MTDKMIKLLSEQIVGQIITCNYYFDQELGFVQIIAGK